MASKELKKIVKEITMASTDQRDKHVHSTVGTTEKYSIKQVSPVCEHLRSNLTIYNKQQSNNGTSSFRPTTKKAFDETALHHKEINCS